MLKIFYDIVYETGNKFEPVDYYTEIMYCPSDFTRSKIANLLKKEIDKLNESTERRVWLGDVSYKEMEKTDYEKS